ncbi:MAG: pectin-derived oligosaccharide transport system substrate-binding protein [Kribbellaceae bacterium]|nr:pectin-derived oligosaccharide transport system substrate-binding protein [Kribbellaceae bacterium]
MRRSIGTAALACAALLAAAGCNGTSVGGTGDSAAGGQDGKGDITGSLQLTFWGGANRATKTNAVADLFVKAHSGVTIDRQNADFGNYFNKLNIQASSKTLPCVMQLQGRQLNDYTKRKVLLPLDPMIESGAIKVDDIPKEVVDTGRGPDGKLYFLPYGAAYDAVGVNETLATEAGVGLPPDGYNWQQYTDWMAKAQAKLPKGVYAAGSRGGLPNYFIAYNLANGKELFTKDGKLGFSKEDLVQYWEMWEKLRKAGVTMGADTQADEPPGAEQGFIAQGKLMTDSIPGNALTPASASLATRPGAQKLTTLPMPSGPSGSGNAMFTSGFAIPTNCTNVPTAAAFIDFFTNDLAAGKVFASDNGAATNKKVLDAQINDPALPALKKHELELYQQIVAKKPPTILYPPGYQATFESAYTRAYEEVAFGKKTVQQAADSFFTEANAGLGG